jgi:hypothetical protein
MNTSIASHVLKIHLFSATYTSNYHISVSKSVYIQSGGL